MEPASNNPQIRLVNSSPGLLGQIKAYFQKASRISDRRANPRNEDPDENRGYNRIFPDREDTPESDAEPDKQLPRDTQHPDEAVSDVAESLQSYSVENEETLPPDPTGKNKHPWEEQMDPSMEEDIPLRPSEVDIPHEIQYSGKNGEFPPDQGTENPEIERPDQGPEIENPGEGPEIEKRDQRPEIEKPDEGQEISRPAKREIDPDQT